MVEMQVFEASDATTFAEDHDTHLQTELLEKGS